MSTRCDACGTDVTPDATKCPGCGATFKSAVADTSRGVPASVAGIVAGVVLVVFVVAVGREAWTAFGAGVIGALATWIVVEYRR